jgi:hypothetical protein
VRYWDKDRLSSNLGLVKVLITLGHVDAKGNLILEYEKNPDTFLRQVLMIRSGNLTRAKPLASIVS